MFFFFSKLLAFVFMPLVWIFGLLIAALVIRKKKRRRRFLLSGIILLYLFSNQFICNEVCRSWEYPFTKSENNVTYDYAVVLGGFSTYDTAFARLKFEDAADRFIQAYQLYQQGKVKRLFLTGGSGSVLYQNETEADKAKDFLVLLKVPEQDIIVDKASRNTRENATCTADWLAKNDPNARCLLITSAAHMRRAIGCYKKVGINFTPYTTHRMAEPRKFDPVHLFVPNAGNLMKWDSIIKEMIGNVVYKVVGYI
jgi:uncharacterized SAM-binding protein YcdF (DUF218 family)